MLILCLVLAVFVYPRVCVIVCRLVVLVRSFLVALFSYLSVRLLADLLVCLFYWWLSIFDLSLVQINAILSML